jgi:glycyl-tRNA synthetase (class II)
LALHPVLAPVKVAVFPLLKNKPDWILINKSVFRKGDT